MEFKLNFDVPQSELQLSHKDSIVLIGSCFSDEMSSYFQKSGFKVESNSFGTIFHPDPIARSLKLSLDDSIKAELFERDGLFFSWSSAGKIYGNSEEELKQEVISRRQKLRTSLKNASVLVVTFGTAWGYRHVELDRVVANCLKAPAKTFQKELSSISNLQEQWNSTIEALKEFNSSLKIIFTVSPVRHKKDGLVENNRSKARLIELVHALTKQEGVSYFPAYEILIDELRDYRFYASDFVHPSKEAVEYVWEKFADFAISPDAMDIAKKVKGLHRELEHKSLYPESAEDKERLERAYQRKEELLRQHPEITFHQ
jgi:hypothetical protein